MSAQWVSASEESPDEKIVVLVRIEGFRKREFVGFHTDVGWFVQGLPKSTKYPVTITQWAKQP